MRNKCFILAERDQEIMKRYAQIVGSERCKTQTEALTRVVQSPCKRFWVTPECAAKVLAKLHKGGDVSKMTPCKQRMYTELYRRFLEKQKLEEYKNMSLSRICEILVEEEAPEFYLLPDTAMDIFIVEKDKRRKKRIAG